MVKSSKYEHKMKVLYCISYYKEQEVLILFFILWHCLILCNEQIFRNLSLWQMRYFLIQNWLSKDSQIFGYTSIDNNKLCQLLRLDNMLWMFMFQYWIKKALHSLQRRIFESLNLNKNVHLVNFDTRMFSTSSRFKNIFSHLFTSVIIFWLFCHFYLWTLYYFL